MFHKYLGQNIVITSLQRVVGILPARFRRMGMIAIFLLMINSVLELFGLASLIPLFSVILEENSIQTNSYLNGVYEWMGFGSEHAFILFLSIFIISVIIFKNGVSLLISRYQAHFSFSLYQYLSARLQRYSYSLGFRFFKTENSNVIARDINSVPLFFANNLVLPLISMVNEMVVLLLILLGIFIYNASILGLLLVFIGPAFFIFYNQVKRNLQQINEQRNDLSAELNKSLYQSIYGYADVVVNNNESWFFKAFHIHAGAMKKIMTQLHVYSMAPTKVIETAMMLGILSIIIYGVNVFEDRTELTMLLGVFAIAAYRILPSINRMLAALMSVKGNQYTLPVVERIKTFEHEEVEQLAITFEKEINVSNLVFSYDQSHEKILKGISFEVKRGEVIGIVGKSGSGKTTLANILLRFLEQTEGDILIDGVVLNKQHLVGWRDLVGYVQQEVYLVDGTMAENITFGSPKTDRVLLGEVLQQASLEELVDSLPEGVSTWVGERGSNLSGGQRQRVGIARALYSGASILFFDEATSALDSDTEQEITEAIRKLAGGDLTIFIIAHRITTLKYCDRIIELEKGKIKSIRDYSELLQESI